MTGWLHPKLPNVMKKPNPLNYCFCPVRFWNLLKDEKVLQILRGEPWGEPKCHSCGGEVKAEEATAQSSLISETFMSSIDFVAAGDRDKAYELLIDDGETQLSNSTASQLYEDLAQALKEIG
uniref:Uncharacterized protein n=1 Tax=Chromera velia CCMP2878 TaxID=1169474 RepID=A0A0G4H5Z5_9ALVE|eukprot:Cvel_24835.t1-p1 / transcript=Cvel_24835.t1 / gene=Cvel_24835 / organism=Chromera_velia_CCMP2878 / gene_product=hypothetical protein / transcript_product=hypothetical protein / location=Cvel_scaffold2739:4983-19628(+) / protein_length=121 / sequence_SO=supercontig / SO=protein_coding / is_pseudo=false